MTEKSHTYTKFQRNAIAAIAKIVGSRAFRYEKTGTGHLKILVEGLPSPIYTSSSPSDSRSILNLKSDVRKMMNIARLEKTLLPPVCDTSACSPTGNKAAKMISYIIKRLRATLDEIEAEEERQAKMRGVDILPALRREIVQMGIDKWLDENEVANGYFTPADLQKIHKDLMQHVNFMLPGLSHYAGIAKAKQTDSKEAATVANENQETEQPEQQPAVPELTVVAETSEPESTPAPEPEQATSAPAEDSTPPATPAAKPIPVVRSEKEKAIESMNSLLAHSPRGRINAFKTLPLSRAQELIAELTKAIDEKHEDDLREVINLIKNKGLDVGEIAERMAGGKKRNAA